MLTQAGMQHSVESLLETSRRQFARLYFVSDESLMQALASSLTQNDFTHNDCHWLPVTRQCFPGIVDIVFERRNSQTDATCCWSSAVNCMISCCYYVVCWHYKSRLLAYLNSLLIFSFPYLFTSLL